MKKKLIMNTTTTIIANPNYSFEQAKEKNCPVNFKFYPALILFLFTIFQTYAQTEMTVKLYDGTEQNFTISENGKIYFSENNLMIEQEKGNPASIELSTVRKLTFNSSLTSVIEKTIENNGIIIYPNPARDYLRIASSESEKMNIKIFSFDGTLMWQGETTISGEINVSHFPAGFYVIKVNEKNFKFCKL